uniref:Cilia- and flagella-associated protein 58 central coiled coil domain-containing protein n=1 Tax=Clastoptera arizonana TaxID=38151 RepID=A0A1B6CV42_9HEMI
MSMYKDLNKTDQNKDDFQVLEVENEIKDLEPIYTVMVSELEGMPETKKYTNEIYRIWAALCKAQENSKELNSLLKENLQNMATNNLKIEHIIQAAHNDEKVITKLQEEVQLSLKMMGAAQSREQYSHGIVKNLRKHIDHLNHDLEQKTRTLEQDGEYRSLAKNEEAQIKQRENMINEISKLKKKLNYYIEYQDEMEKTNTSKDKKIEELTQELKNQINETSKEARFKENTVEDLHQVQTQLKLRDNDIKHLKKQILEYQQSIAQYQETIRDQKISLEKMNQHLEIQLVQSNKLSQDLHKNWSKIEEDRQKIEILTKQLQFKEESEAKLTIELTNANKVLETFKKKLNKMEAEKLKVIEQKKKLEVEMEKIVRSMDNDRYNLGLEVQKVNNLKRKEEITADFAIKTKLELEEQIRLVKIKDKDRTQMEQEISNNRITLTKQSQQIIALENEKNRYVSETVILTKKVEAAYEDLQLKGSEIIDYRKKIAQIESQLTDKISLYESVRYELNNCSKNLIEAQDDISELTHKSRVMILQIEQLKDDIAGKETQLINEKLALHKVQEEKQAMKIEVQKFKDQFNQSRNMISVLTSEKETLEKLLKQADNEQKKDKIEKEKILNDKAKLSTLVVKLNGELAQSHDNLKVFQSIMDKEKVQFSQKLEDIRILKLEVNRLSNEKQVLTSSLQNMVDLRTEVHNLEKNLTKERLKSQALTEEQQNPLNVHRWRKLEGTDPDTHMLLMKTKIQQSRVLKKTKDMLDLQNKYDDLERQFNCLTMKQPQNQNTADLNLQLNTLQRDLNLKANKIKGLIAELNGREAQAKDFEVEIYRLNHELNEMKKKYYEQKEKSDKLNQKLKDIKLPENEALNSKENMKNNVDDMNKGIQKPYFTGGGFNMRRNGT